MRGTRSWDEEYSKRAAAVAAAAARKTVIKRKIFIISSANGNDSRNGPRNGSRKYSHGSVIP